MISLTDEENESHENSNSNMNCKLSKNIPVVFHNGSRYDYHFIIKELAQEFEGQFECLGENIEKCITFSVHSNKEIIKIAILRL